MASTINHKSLTPIYPTIQATIEAWSSLTRNEFPGETQYKLNIPLTTYTYLIQNLSTHHWKQRGIPYTTTDLVNPTVLDIFMIQQIRHYRRKHLPTTITVPLPIWDFLLSKTKSNTKGISLCYRYYNFHTAPTKLPAMAKCENGE